MPDIALTERILGAVDEGFDAQVALTTELTRFPSLRGQEATAQDFMARAFAERGWDVDRWKIELDDIKDLPGFSPVTISYDEAWNVVGALRPTRPKGKSLILNGHIDVVPTGPLALWSRPPFEPWVSDGWLYGRGTGDMKAGLVSCVAALDALARLGYRPAADVYVQSVVEEECTGNGALACLQRGYKAAAAIIPEPMGNCVSTAQIGVMWVQVRIQGRPAHVGHAEQGANAIESAFPVIQALKDLGARWNHERHPLYQHHDHPLNFVLSRIEGGDWTSSVPSWCSFDMRLGIYPGVELAWVRQEVERVVSEASLHDPFLSNHPPEVVYHGFQAEGYVVTGADEPLGLLDACHQRAFGVALPQVATTATTDARFFGLYAGIPALVYGPHAVDYHGFDERVELDSLRRVTQAIALFVADWCGLEETPAPQNGATS